MEKLIGMDLEVKVPFLALSKIGQLEGNEKLQSIFEEIHAIAKKRDEDSAMESMAEYTPYLANSVFLPIVISEMIEKNLTFDEAVKSSSEKVKKSVEEWNTDFAKGESDDQIFIQSCSNLQQAAGRFQLECSGEEQQKSWKAVINIENISEKLAKAIKTSGLLELSERIYNKECVSKDFKEKAIEPTRNAVINTINAFRDKGIISWTRADEIIKGITPMIDRFGIIKQSEIILNFVLEKAINEGITFEKAVSAVDEDYISEVSAEIFNVKDTCPKIKIDNVIAQVQSMLLLTSLFG